MLLVVALCCFVVGARGTPLLTVKKCAHAPLHAQPADQYYRLSIAGDPDLYLPGELYTVSLQGVDSGEGPTPFTSFTIWAEDNEQHAESVKINKSGSIVPKQQSLGSFQAYDAQTKLYEDCEPAVENATAHPKTEIQVIWSAPFTAHDGCIQLCARVPHVKAKEGAEQASAWSELARKLCPAPIAAPNANRQAPILEPCCACDEAKYEVTFEGLWSRNTHPREFPPEATRAHFGEVIGASHTAQYRVWQEGRVASRGLRRLADDGTTTALEKELKEESDNIRTIIKARGISWQQVSGSGVPTTFAVFRVDAKHHLMSLVSKLAPSPDWIVGVSALELCNANCSWTKSATLPLYPYDAGADNGIAYTSRRQPTSPPAPVRALRPDWPRDPNSPFYNVAGEMRPFARLRLTRLRLYEKNCESLELTGEAVADIPLCETDNWGEWSPCSVTCGPGWHTRQRHYLLPKRAFKAGCRVKLTDREDCYGPRINCRVVSEYEPDPASSTGPCAVSGWEPWSPCEGCGVSARTRHYVYQHKRKRCHVGFRARTVMSQARPCPDGPCYQPPEYANSSNFNWFYRGRQLGECQVTAWGDWSPCSAICGRGRMLRSRLFVAKDSRYQYQLTRRLLYDWNKRFAELQNLESSNFTIEDPEIEAMVQEHLERCQFTMTKQEALCDGKSSNCKDITTPKDVCLLPHVVGYCRSYMERWFFDKIHGSCEPFGYTGCGGNENNFRTQDICQRYCQGALNDTAININKTNKELIFKKLKPTPYHADNDVMHNDSPESTSPVEDVDCKTGKWLGWSECFGNCGHAIKLNHRLVVQHETGLGKPCQKLVKTRTCKLRRCRKLFHFTNTTSSSDNELA